MTSTRVGVLSHDIALIVDLSLRATGMSVRGIDDVEELRDYDVALVDVREGADPLDALMPVPPGPARVVLCHDLPAVIPDEGPVTIVERPCSLAEVLDAVRSALPAPVPVGAGAPAPSTSPLEAGDEARENAEDDGLVVFLDDAGPTHVAPMPPVPVRSERQALGTVILTAAADDVATWAIGREPGLDRRSLGDRLAGRMAEMLEADSIVIWGRGDEAYTILGAFGIPSTDRVARIPADHPVLRFANNHGGVYLRTSGRARLRAPGFPGTGSACYAFIVLPDGSGPASLLTVGAPELPADLADGLRDLMIDVASLWPTS